MNSTKFVLRLLLAALVCAAFAARAAAQRRPAEASAQKVSAEAPTPHALWKDVRVEFEGNRLFTAERLRALTAECYRRIAEDEAPLNPGLLTYCVESDVLDFVRRSGYLRAEMGEMRMERTSAGETVTVPFDEKELYRLGHVNIEGAEFFKAAQLRELLPLRRGDIADAIAIDRWLGEHMKKFYADEGFIQYEYEVEPEFKLDTDTGDGVADFAVNVNEGRRFRLRRVTFASSADVPEDVLRGVLRLKEGEFFSARGFRDAVLRLNQLDAPGWLDRFEQIDPDKEVVFQADEETADLDINIHLMERRGERPEREAARPEATDGAPGKPRLVRRPQTREE